MDTIPVWNVTRTQGYSNARTSYIGHVSEKGYVALQTNTSWLPECLHVTQTMWQDLKSQRQKFWNFAALYRAGKRFSSSTSVSRRFWTSMSEHALEEVQHKSINLCGSCSWMLNVCFHFTVKVSWFTNVPLVKWIHKRMTMKRTPKLRTKTVQWQSERI